MKHIINIIIVLFTQVTFGQSLCRTDIMNGNELFNENKITDFLMYDFSNLLLKTENENIYGIIGSANQRFCIKFLKVEKSIENPKEYLVYGKTNVEREYFEFAGKIFIEKIQVVKAEKFGVDDELKNTGIKTQGLLTAKYELFETKSRNSGVYTGRFESKWFIDKYDKINYNDIDLVSDGYFNNAFVGTRKLYNSKVEKICNWGDFRVPSSDCDFDNGTGDFNVSEKYKMNGWWIKPKMNWWQ